MGSAYGLLAGAAVRMLRRAVMSSLTSPDGSTCCQNSGVSPRRSSDVSSGHQPGLQAAGAAPLVALGPPLTAGWLRRPAFVRKRARARTKAHRFLIPRSVGCLPKRDAARPPAVSYTHLTLPTKRIV